MVTPPRLIAILGALNILLVAAGLVFVAPPATGGVAGIRVGLVFDIGGKNDKTFNEAAYRGLERAKKELGIEVEYVEPSEGADRESAMRGLAARGFDLVIGVGYIFGPDLERLAVQFPAIRFAGVDYAASPGVGVLPNLAGLRFREHEGGFLVGTIAALITRTKVVAFVGGMKLPLIRKFEAGYEAGVRHTCPTCRVLSAYAGTEPKAFANPTLGQELASALYGQGADVIFHAAGQTGIGVFAAAKQRNALAIGVDSDQFDAAPCCVVTSMIKNVDVAVFDIIKKVIDGQFKGGMYELGLAEGAVSFVADERNRGRLLPLDVEKRAKAMRDEIIAGKIKVPDR